MLGHHKVPLTDFIDENDVRVPPVRGHAELHLGADAAFAVWRVGTRRIGLVRYQDPRAGEINVEEMVDDVHAGLAVGIELVGPVQGAFCKEWVGRVERRFEEVVELVQEPGNDALVCAIVYTLLEPQFCLARTYR
jgi:hypothetical protein